MHPRAHRLRRHRPARLRRAALVACGLAVLAVPAGAAPGDESGGKTAEQQQKIERLNAEMMGSAAEQDRLKAEIEAIRSDRAKLNAALLEAAARQREAEAKLDASEERLSNLEKEEGDIRRSLDSRRGVLAQVLGSLMRMGRQPPPALLVRPDDALGSVRSAMLLGAVLPELREETDLLVAELTEQERVRAELTRERDALAELKGSFEIERRRIAALVEQRQRNQESGESALAGERKRAAALAAEASNVRELMERMETEIAAARRAAEEAAKADAAKAAEAAKAAANMAAPQPGDRLAALQNPGRLTPAVAFAETRGHLLMPVSGQRLRDFGTPDGFGGAEKGLTIGTRPEAQVTAPADGWVVYAGPFRRYGQLLIINAGDGYHILMAGMDRISVELGQFVLSGEPIAVMGRSPQVAAVGLGTAQPVLYVEFRKDGTTIDPTPWWVTSESEKVRG
ncbi:murein hydrolase activator EnvC family protein [Ancylobacter terrae]|uniref:murein hydrolase activator EnvC family protein n=1 Tax=Ancylobacter sp. sgz301288 TaxID=3342077 RepID=UPI0038582E31